MEQIINNLDKYTELFSPLNIPCINNEETNFESINYIIDDIECLRDLKEISTEVLNTIEDNFYEKIINNDNVIVNKEDSIKLYKNKNSNNIYMINKEEDIQDLNVKIDVTKRELYDIIFNKLTIKDVRYLCEIFNIETQYTMKDITRSYNKKSLIKLILNKIFL